MADDELLDEEEGQGEAQYQPAAASGLNRIVKILIYAALAVVGLVIMAWISYFVAKYAAASQYREVASIAVVKPPPPLESFRFADDFRVNTADIGESHFIKMKMSIGFEAGQPALSAELAQRVPQLRDIINLILAAKTKEELSSIQAQLELREEIKANINHIMSEGKVVSVFFDEFIIN
jgi:flagellar protein FliL